MNLSIEARVKIGWNGNISISTSSTLCNWGAADVNPVIWDFISGEFLYQDSIGIAESKLNIAGIEKEKVSRMAIRTIQDVINKWCNRLIALQKKVLSEENELEWVYIINELYWVINKPYYDIPDEIRSIVDIECMN